MTDFYLTVCIDCALLIANDDLSALAPEDEQQHRDMFAAYQEDTNGYLVVTLDEDDGEHFGSTPCAGCGTTMAGTRVDAQRIS